MKICKECGAELVEGGRCICGKTLPDIHLEDVPSEFCSHECKEEANSQKFHCELCGQSKIDGQSCYYKWPDAGMGGSDLDGFCCMDCAKEPPWKQWEIMQRQRIKRLAELSLNKSESES